MADKKPIKPVSNPPKPPLAKTPVTKEPTPAVKPKLSLPNIADKLKAPSVPISSGIPSPVVDQPVAKKPVAPVTSPATSAPVLSGTQAVNLGQPSRSVVQLLQSDVKESIGVVQAALAAELRQESARALDEAGYPEMASIVRQAPDADFAKLKDMPVRQWILDTVSPKIGNQALAREKLEKASQELPESLTVGEVLGLDVPLKMHPLFRATVSREKLNGLLAISPLIPASARSVFLERAENFQGSGEEFWKEIKQRPEFSKPETVQEVERLFQLDVLSQSNRNLVLSLETLRKKGGWKELKDLAGWDAAKWIDVVRSAGIDDDEVLEEIEGETQDEKIPAYAKNIAENLRLAFPVETLRRRFESGQVAKVAPAMQKNLSKVLAKAHDLDLSNEHLEEYFSRRSDVLADVENKDEVKGELKRIQRIFRIAPDVEKAQALLDEGLDSAHAITSLSWPTFAKRFSSALGGEAQARSHYLKAAHVAAASSSVMGAIAQAKYGIDPAVLATAKKDALKDMPTLANLFGSLDLCECKHCASVYSPAAYLVDLLHFLSKASSGRAGSVSALEVLRRRRPDLEHMKLTCENTETALPYVDLVNEILEYCVVSGKLDKDAANDTRGMSAQELEVNPQFVNDAAYEKLAKEVYPMSLPFHRPVEVTRAYLEHLGSSYYELLHTFRTNPGEPSLAIACEALRIDPLEQKILTGEDGTATRAFYGYTAEKIGGQSWLEDLSKIPNFLKRTGLSFSEVLELLKTRYVNPEDTLSVETPPGEVDLQKTTIKNLSPKRLEDIHRFIRLRRKLGWSIQEVDNALLIFVAEAKEPGLGTMKAATDPGMKLEKANETLKLSVAEPIDPKVLRNLSIVSQLKTELRMKVPALLSFWGMIDTSGENSFYEKLFLNKAVFHPLDDAFRLNAKGTALQGASGRISSHAPAILAALGINAQDFAAIRQVCGLEEVQGTASKTLPFASKGSEAQKKGEAATDPPKITKPGSSKSTKSPKEGLSKGSFEFEAPVFDLTLENLSTLFRHAALAKALRIPVRDFLTLKALVGSDPFASPAATLAFVRTARKVRESNFKPAQLDYLLRHTWDPARPYAPTEELVGLFLNQIHQGLRAIWEETAVPEDPSGEILNNKMAAVLPVGLVADAMAIVDGSTLLAESEQNAFIAEHFSLFVNAADVQAAFLASANLPPEEKRQSRIAFVLKTLMAHLRQSLAKSFIVQSFADRFGIETDVTTVLVTQILKSQESASKPLIADFLVLMDAMPASIAPQVSGYRLLHKISMIVKGFSITPTEAAHLQIHGADFSGFDWNALPMSPSAFKAKHFDQWERLYDLFSLRGRMPESEARLTDVLTADGKKKALETLRQATGWDQAELEFAAGVQGLDLAPDDFRTEKALLRLESCLRLAGRIGLSVKHLFTWAEGNADTAQAKSMIQTVRAKYEEQEWLQVGKSLNDRLREMQREALVAYLLPRTFGVDTPNQMFEHFLIDVNMNPVMKTSRIKQAISSVQTFIQRSLMNLETGVSPDDLDEDRWEWMKNYRVWEANRKVFLYPENWIEPELRDDKSPFFRELEAELLQSDLNLESAERAFLNYLSKLEEVSRLQMCGLYHQVEEEDGVSVDVLHAFGRSFGSPHVYYYRSYSFQTDHWTPWEKMNLDIEGDHLIPIVFNRRLYLFWPIFEEKTAEGPKNSDGETLSRGYWQIKLAWSEYLGGKWSAKKTTKDFFTSWPKEKKELVPTPIDKHFFNASVWTDGKAQVLSVYLWIDRNTANNTETSISTMAGGYFSFHDTVGDYTYNDHGDEGGGHFVSAPAPENSSLLFEAYRVSGDFKIPQYDKGQVPVLNGSSTFRMLLPHDLFQDFYEGYFPFFYQDNSRVYFVRPKVDGPEPKGLLGGALGGFTSTKPSVAKGGSEKRISTSGETRVLLGSSSGGSGTSFRTTSKFPSGGGKKIALRKMSNSWSNSPKGEQSKKAIEGGSGSFSFGGSSAKSFARKMYLHFETFFHPHSLDFIRGINRKGVPGLLTLENQKLTNDDRQGTIFEKAYKPTELVHWDRPQEIVEFSTGAPYAIYNWELFFHIPLLIATSLVREGRYDDSFHWFHTIFNPMSDSSEPAPRRYWNVLPFYRNVYPGKEQIQEMLEALSYKGTINRSLLRRKNEVLKQIEEWRDDPFNPHAIARMRITAYQKNVVMKYIDALIAKADQLFAMDTIETINEATQFYVLAANILGPRPEEIPSQAKPSPKTFDQLKDKLDGFSNALVSIENEFTVLQMQPSAKTFYRGKLKENNVSMAKRFEMLDQKEASNGFHLAKKKPQLEMRPKRPPLGKMGKSTPPVLPGVLHKAFYFGIPKNDKLLSYWDTVSDRLFKIRHGLNLEGVERPLALFEPPIDPALLVRARAMGMDLTSVLSDLRSASPRCRFSYMIQKALELCAEVKSMGHSLLSVLEKKDAEELSQLRQRHEVSVLKAVRDVKKRQIEEARTALSSLQKQRDVTTVRHTFYKNIAYRNSQEERYMAELEEARSFEQQAQYCEATGAGLANIPDFTTGSEGASPVATNTFGGSNLAKGQSANAAAFSYFGAIHAHKATMASIIGDWHRRWDDWKLQEKLAAKELLQIEKQILAAEIRVDISERELENHDLQIENAQEVESFLSNKFTSRDLYGWMVSRVSSVYFQVYKLAYDLSKKAERAWQMEYGPGPGGFVKFGYWDSLKKGLLAGEEMWLDLKRMEAAALEAPRDYEITKNISLLQLAPMALVSLKETGSCDFVIPEELFAMDFPSHYNRRIKSVNVTIPCVTGPYANINATLTLLENKIRISPAVTEGFSELEDEEDTRFVHNYGPIQSIATSTGQNDGGLFELNFRDERFLPFEGAGVASRWKLELRKESNAFDLDTVSDVILTMSLRSREGGEMLAKAARQAVVAEPQENLTRLFSLKHEFPMEWHRFLNPVGEAKEQRLEWNLTSERFPFSMRTRELTIAGMEILLKLKASVAYPGAGQPLKLSVTAPEGVPVKATLQSVLSFLGGIPRATFDLSSESAGLGVWKIEAKEADIKLMDAKLRQVAGPGVTLQRLKPEMIDDLLVLVKYAAQ